MLLDQLLRTSGTALDVSAIVARFRRVIATLEEIYHARPFNQQTAQSLTELYLLVKAVQPHTILELGAGSRSSTIALGLAAAELSQRPAFHSYDMCPTSFPPFMARHFPALPYIAPTDHAGNIIHVKEPAAFEPPVLLLYDMHDDDIPGVKVWPHIRDCWLPKLRGQIVLIHDCSILPNNPNHSLPPSHFARLHFSGRLIAGFAEVLGLTDWLNANRIQFCRPGDELAQVGLPGNDSSFIYFVVP